MLSEVFARLGEWVNPLAVFVGGGTGALARYAIGRWAAQFEAVASFPWHTLAINVLGSFVLGMVAVLYKERPTWFILLGTGVCGGFTTFSTFSVETLTMLEKGRTWVAVGYVAGSVAAGLYGAMLGMRIARGE